MARRHFFLWDRARTGGIVVVVPPTPSTVANAFILDQSTLAGGQYRTVPFDMTGEFRQVQFGWRQGEVSEDMEPHYLEFHFTVSGVAEEG